jgi:hypothetical protein
MPLLNVPTVPERLPLTAADPVGWHLLKLRVMFSGTDSLPKFGVAAPARFTAVMFALKVLPALIGAAGMPVNLKAVGATMNCELPEMVVGQLGVVQLAHSLICPASGNWKVKGTAGISVVALNVNALLVKLPVVAVIVPLLFVASMPAVPALVPGIKVSACPL